MRKRVFVHMRTAMAQISLRMLIRAFTVRSQNHWILQNVWMMSKGSDDTLRMRKIILICALIINYVHSWRHLFAWRSPSSKIYFIFFFREKNIHGKKKTRQTGQPIFTEQSLHRMTWTQHKTAPRRKDITKTHLFKYIENFTSKNWKFSDKRLWYFSYFCSKHRLRNKVFTEWNEHNTKQHLVGKTLQKHICSNI